MNANACIAALLALAGGLATPALGHTLANARITVRLADAAILNFPDNDRVDVLSWINSSGASTGNLVANGGDSCGDARESFGQSYSEIEGNGFFMIAGGSTGTWTQSAEGLTGTSRTSSNNCATPYGTTTTTYTLYKAANKVSAMRVRRVFAFDRAAAAASTNLRAYVPRFPLSRFPTVLAPDATGAVQSYSTCETACEISSWKGNWFADDDGHGNGIMVVRDSSSTAAAAVALDNDSISASNLTSIVIKPPAGGWSGRVTETQWLCFYDPSNWSMARRAAGQLPIGCTVPAHP